MRVPQHSEGLYDPSFEHDACGIGFVANIKGNKSHQHIADALPFLKTWNTAAHVAVK
jgi:glutamate synthase (NADPH/NADH) large chain